MAMRKKLNRKQRKAQEVRGLRKTRGINTRKGAMQRTMKDAMTGRAWQCTSKGSKASNGKLKEKCTVPASQARSLNDKSLHAMAVEMPLNIKMWQNCSEEIRNQKAVTFVIII